MTTKRKPVKPGTYNKAFADELAKQIPELFTGTQTLLDVCEELQMNKRSFFKLCALSEDLTTAYRARDISGIKPNSPPVVYTKDYADDLAPDLPEMFKGGASLAQVCQKLEMSKNTFHKMCASSPDLMTAYKKGLDYSEAWWADVGQQGAVGELSINAATWIFNMKNRFKWKDRFEHSGPGDTPLVPALNAEALSTETLMELADARDEKS